MSVLRPIQILSNHCPKGRRNTKWGKNWQHDLLVEYVSTNCDTTSCAGLETALQNTALAFGGFFWSPWFKNSQSRSPRSILREILLWSQTEITFQKIKRTDEQAESYHKNSLKSIRSAINQYLQDIRRSKNIVRDKEFKSANHILEGMFKSMTKTDASRATNHKSVIHPEYLTRISTYFLSAP